jgi:UDP-N-acetylglucosamine--N-acetylmuramyl-(pentapeptide) pyrophosphoryl-undecaprenol N-acetylglucosamine transferase
MTEVASSHTAHMGDASSLPSAKPLRVLVAASGTGGHLIPALHIVRALQAQSSGAVVEFIGAGRPLEEKLIVGNGFRRHIVSSAGVKRRGVVGMIQFVAKLPIGMLQCAGLFRRFRPDAVVGVGGYVSVLPVVVARLMGIPTWIHEAELHPGLANKVLGYFADRVSTAFEETRVRGRAQAVCTGHPVRPELKAVHRDVVREGAPSRLLVLGGSQGAKGLDEAVTAFAERLNARGVEVVHQCRPESVDLVLNSYRAARVRATVVSFIDDMAGAYEWSDVIISRAGASSVAEISCVNRPAILVPYPFQQGTHQTDNAHALARLRKAVVVEENQPEFGRRLSEALEAILTPETFREMRNAPAEPRGLGAADAIALGILAIARPDRSGNAPEAAGA